MDSLLRELDKKAEQGDIDALRQAYHILKRGLPNISLSSLSYNVLKDLVEDVQGELYRNRSFVLQWGSSERRDFSVAELHFLTFMMISFGTIKKISLKK